MSVEIDEVGVVRHRGTEHEERIAWADLTAVLIVTTDEGPFVEDWYWMLLSPELKGVVVPGADAAPLLERLQRLPRFDNEAVINASQSTESARFLVWQGEAGEALPAGGPPHRGPLGQA